MSDKLQGIKQKNQDSLKMISKEPSFYLPNELVLIDHNTWLIEQLEQAQQENAGCHDEIEQLREENAYLHAKVMHLEPQNQKLIEALGWYADETNYKQEYRSEGVLMYSTNVRDDRGQRARDILQEVSHGTSTES